MMVFRWMGSACVALGLLSGCGGANNIGTNAAGNGTPDTGGGTSTGTGTGSTYRAGTLDTTGFKPGVLSLGAARISAGGTTSVAVDIVDANGARVSGVPAAVTFSSPCLTDRRSTITPATVNTTQGRATASYVAAGCTGSDLIRASVAIAGSTTAAEATVVIDSTELGSLSFVSATPTTIGMRGTPYQQQSAVVFKLINRNGAAVSGREVRFAVSNRVGGLEVSPATTTTDSSGLAQTTLIAGTAQTIVRIAATATTDSGQQLTTQSEQLIVSTGLPDADSVSLSSDKLSLDGNCDGESAILSLRAADRYNNPPPAGTAVAFTTEGGKINSGCVMADASDPTAEGGVCSTLLAVQSPRPSNGRVTVLASISGEETFTDSNSNGYYDQGEPFVDLLEPYRDDNENGTRDNNEFFRDANDNNQYETAPNGRFDGYVCAVPGSASNNNTPANCATRTFPLGASGVVVFSSGTPVASDISGQATTYRVSSAGMVAVTVADTNGNSLPTGTTFTLALSNGTVSEPATLGPYNVTGPSPLKFRFTTGATATPVGGQEAARLTVQLPATKCGAGESRVSTLFTYTVI